MQGALGKIAISAVVLLALTACSSNEPQLLNLRSDNTGPDEFLILPTKPLEAPEDFTALPEPTPGGTNRADPTPRADAVSALGGDGERVIHSDLRSNEQGIVAHASRYGVSPDIREDLAAADLEWRRQNDGRLLERLLNVSVYFRAYRKMSLDQHLELERLRRLGIWTPAAPPESEG